MIKKYSYLNNLKTVLAKQWDYNHSYILALLGDVPIGVFASIITAYLPKIVLENIENHTATEYMVIDVSIFSIMLVIAKYIEKVLLSYESKCFELSRYDLYKKELLNKLMDMDYNNFIYNETRIYKEKANRAVEDRDNGIASFLLLNKQFLSSLFGFAAFGTIIAQCNIWFIPILILSYILSSIGWMLLQRYNTTIKNKRAKVFLQLNYVTFHSKSFTDAKDIRIYNMFELLMTKIERHLLENIKFDIKKNNGHYLNVLFEDIIKFTISLCAYLYLLNQKLNTDMSIGDFILYFGAITGFGNWLGKVVNSVISLIECNNNVKDYRLFLELENKKQLTKECVFSKHVTNPCSIEIENITFSYENTEKPVLSNFSLFIKPGEKIAIVGANGTGKSTLIKLICGLFSPQKGNIYINQINSLDFERQEYYKMFSTIFQDVSFLPTSIAKNIALCEDSDIDDLKLSNCIRLAGLEDKINSLPQKEKTLLIHDVNKSAISLSGGEMQSLLLARALYKDAPIIILDEPTAALDPIAENNIYLKYSELTKNKTVIFISHRLSSTKFCDRIILINDANVAESGTHEELISVGGLYAKMYETQSKYYTEDKIYE